MCLGTANSGLTGGIRAGVAFHGDAGRFHVYN